MNEAMISVIIDDKNNIDMSVKGLPRDLICMMSYVINYLIENGVVSGLTYREKRYVILKEIFKYLEEFKKDNEQEDAGANNEGMENI